MTVRAYHTWNQMPRQDGFPDGSVSVTVDFPVESAARPIRYLLVERKTQGRQATEAQILIFLGSLRLCVFLAWFLAGCVELFHTIGGYPNEI